MVALARARWRTARPPSADRFESRERPRRRRVASRTATEQ